MANFSDEVTEGQRIVRVQFEIEHRTNSVKATDMHQARAGKMSGVIEEAKVFFKNYT